MNSIASHPLNGRAPRAIFFDLDQTLIQHETTLGDLVVQALLEHAPHRAADLSTFQRALATEGARLWSRISERPEGGIQALQGVIARALESVALDATRAAEILEHALHQVVDLSRPTMSAHATLDSLRERGVLLGIITNGFTDVQERKAFAHGFLDRVQTLVTSERAGVHKPDRRIFELALSALRVGPAESWYVGDNFDKDVCGAALVGMTSVLFDPRGVHGSIDRAGLQKPDYVISDLQEVVGLVKELDGKGWRRPQPGA